MSDTSEDQDNNDTFAAETDKIFEELGIGEVEGDTPLEETAEKKLEGGQEAPQEVIEEKPVEQPPAQEVQAIEPPQSWQGEKEAAVWASLPKEAQEYITQREQKYVAEIQQKDEFIKEYGFVKDIVEPQRQNLAIHGQTPAQALQQLVAVNEFALTNPTEYLQWYCGRMGVNLQDLALQYMRHEEELTPEQKELRAANQRIQALEQQFQNNITESVNKQVADEIAAFERNPANKYFAREDVRKEVGFLIGNGKAATIAEAYDKAIYMFPDIRQEMLREQALTQAANSNAAVEKSKTMAGRKLPSQSLNVPEKVTYEEKVDEIFQSIGL